MFEYASAGDDDRHTVISQTSRMVSSLHHYSSAAPPRGCGQDFYPQSFADGLPGCPVPATSSPIMAVVSLSEDHDRHVTVGIYAVQRHRHCRMMGVSLRSLPPTDPSAVGRSFRHGDESTMSTRRPIAWKGARAPAYSSPSLNTLCSGYSFLSTSVSVMYMSR